MSEPVIKLRALVIVLGDQLDRQSSAFDDFDAARDAVWMAEVTEESTHVWSGKQRIAVFLSAMRHFADALRNEGSPLHYTRLDEHAQSSSLAAELQLTVDRLKPQKLVMCAPGDWRVYQSLRSTCAKTAISTARHTISLSTPRAASHCDSNTSTASCGSATGC